jgi:hypothetical protein
MTDPSGYANTLALPARVDAPRLLRYDDVTAHAITRGDPRRRRARHQRESRPDPRASAGAIWRSGWSAAGVEPILGGCPGPSRNGEAAAGAEGRTRCPGCGWADGRLAIGVEGVEGVDDLAFGGHAGRVLRSGREIMR